jgi:hypothetical protein
MSQIDPHSVIAMRLSVVANVLIKKGYTKNETAMPKLENDMPYSEIENILINEGIYKISSFKSNYMNISKYLSNMFRGYRQDN